MQQQGHDRDRDRRIIRERLTDPLEVATLLGLLDGHKKTSAREIKVLCPSHAERTASCNLREGPDGTLQVRCFGCGFGGDVYTLAAAVLNVEGGRDFPRVLNHLAALIGYTVEGGDVSTSPVAYQPRPPRPPEPPALDDDTFNRIASDLLERCPVDRDAEVAAYLHARGLLGEAKLAGWGALPPAGGRALFAELAKLHGGPEALALAGLGWRDRAGRPSDSFVFRDNRLVIPYRLPGTDAPIYTLQRRHLTNAREAKYVFAKGRPVRWPYGVEALEEVGQGIPVMLVEGAPDVLDRRAKLRAAGIPRVVLGLPGVESWRPAWATLGARRAVWVGLDNDRAGQGKTKHLIADLREARAISIRAVYPDGDRKDWNTHGHA